MEICNGGNAILTATVAGASNCDTGSCCSRTVSNTILCDNGNPNVTPGISYAFYLFNEYTHRNRFYAFTSSSTVVWEECADGTIRYQATGLEALDGSGDRVSFDFTFSGRTTQEPAEGFKEHNCFRGFSISDWVYYTGVQGTINTTLSGSFQVTRRGPAFQMGIGANQTSSTLAFGASTWFDIVSGNGDWTIGDINIMLSQTCTTTSTSGVTYEWSTGDTGASISVNEAGTYTVTATGCDGCTATDEITVTDCPASGAGTGSGAGTTFEDCGVSFTHDGLTITTTGTQGATVMVLDKTTWQQAFSCYPWGDGCDDNITITLEPGRTYEVKLQTYGPGCTLIQEIVTPAALTGSTSRSRVANTTDNVRTTDSNKTLTAIATSQQKVADETTSFNTLIVDKVAAVEVYPNPAFQNLNVNLSSYAGQKGQLILINGMGQRASNFTIDQLDSSPVTLDVSNLVGGFYYLQVVIDGELKDMQKVIVEKR